VALAVPKAQPKKPVPSEETNKKTAQVDSSLIAEGKVLFQTKVCFTCHQVDPKVPSPAGAALKAPGFIGKFWGTEREVHVGAAGGPTEKVTMNEDYFLESVEKPMAKILKGAIPGMAPLPTTLKERKALLAYVKSLSK
jgi:mono/diheme cytochrome c family protein